MKTVHVRSYSYISCGTSMYYVASIMKHRHLEKPVVSCLVEQAPKVLIL